MQINKERLLEDVDALTVCETLGIQTATHGSTIYCECTSGLHKETKINHCKLFSNGCYCFTCNNRKDTVSIVMDYYKNKLNKPIGFKKALELILACVPADQRNKYIISGKYRPTPDEKDILGFKLKEEELNCLNLTSKNISLIVQKINGNYSDRSGTITYLKKKDISSIHRLKKKILLNLLIRKAEEMIPVYQKITNKYQSPKNSNETAVFVESQIRQNKLENLIVALKEKQAS